MIPAENGIIASENQVNSYLPGTCSGRASREAKATARFDAVSNMAC